MRAYRIDLLHGRLNRNAG